MPTDTCLCGRYEWPDQHCIGARYCSTCGEPVSANPTAAIGPEDKRTSYRCGDGTVYLTRDEADEHGEYRPIKLTPGRFWELPEG